MSKVLDYKGNEINNLLAYGVRKGKGYDFVIPTHHALKDYDTYLLDNSNYDFDTSELSYDEQLEQEYEHVLRQTVLFNLDKQRGNY